MTTKILLVLTAGGSPPLGDVWGITAKESGFYLDAVGRGDFAHLSFHGPKEELASPRFHIKIDRKRVELVKAQGDFVLHGRVPPKGLAFDGQQVADRAFRIARLRRTWHLQQPQYRVAAVSGQAPDLADHQSGARMSDVLKPNEAWDVDLVISFDKPYWPDPDGSLRDNARLGPLESGSGFFLTGTSYRRSEIQYPAPNGLSLQPPQQGEQPNRIMCGGFEHADAGDMYWFVETITSRQLIDRTSAVAAGSDLRK
ncbi:hypothetical protein [Pengzhenrongella sp.]|jgi:hypothetical protein|uniref:hypothetical protein n=1 Tax=Pengzhenrongella sp. TaxID=2888820 RepID=UPI002F93B8DE